MANVKDIRTRVRSVKNTQQITRAMKMVAAAKLRKAHDRTLSSRPYAVGLSEVLERVGQRAEAARHPLLKPSDKGYRLLVVVTSDRGLCGGFNTNLMKQAMRWLEACGERGEDARVYVIGRKGRDFFRHRSYPIVHERVNLFAKLSFGNAVMLGDQLARLYTDGEARDVTIIYNHFKSMIAQKITELKLLPVLTEVAAGDGAGQAAQAKPQGSVDYIYEPDADSILEKLLPLHVHNQVFHALEESLSSEHAARMMAMENATKNAGEMIDKLTLTMNKIRQAAITNELIEVVSGASSLED